MLEVVEAAAEAQNRETSSWRTGCGCVYLRVCICVRDGHGMHITQPN